MHDLHLCGNSHLFKLSGYPLPDNLSPPTTLMVLGGPSLHTYVAQPVHFFVQVVSRREEKSSRSEQSSCCSIHTYDHIFLKVTAVNRVPNADVAAGCSTIVGVGLPVYSSFKAIETKNEAGKEEWLIYWSGEDSQEIASKSIISFYTLQLRSSVDDSWHCYVLKPLAFLPFSIAAYGCFSVAETFSDKLLSWCVAVTTFRAWDLSRISKTDL